ncbi:hypothetical protein [Paenibacillus sp. FSL E2-0178]
MTGFKGVQLILRCMPFYCCLEQHIPVRWLITDQTNRVIASGT